MSRTLMWNVVGCDWPLGNDSKRREFERQKDVSSEFCA